jgi:hypothetical protein
MRISFSQPAFIPWGGLFARLIQSDVMVLLDDTVLGRGFTYVNRNRLKGPEGEVRITVPLKRKDRGAQKIKDLEVYEKDKWAKKFLLTLRHYYTKSVFFEPIFEKICKPCESLDAGFFSLIFSLLNILKSSFGIEREFCLQSEMGLAGKGTPLLAAIAGRLGSDTIILPCQAEKAVDCRKLTEEGIRVQFLRYLPAPYPQFWGDFVMNLSALDLLLCLGPSGRGVIERGIRVSE